MSVVLELPASLSRFAGGQRVIELQATHLRELVDRLCREFPDLRIRILDSDGDLYPYLPLFRGSEKLPLRDLESVAVHDGDRLEVVELASGG